MIVINIAVYVWNFIQLLIYLKNKKGNIMNQKISETTHSTSCKHETETHFTNNNKEGSQGTEDSKIIPSGNKDSNYRFEFNRNYFSICIYALGVIALGTVIIYSIVNFSGTKDIVRRLLQVMSPFILAFFIAYLLHPMVVKINKLLEKTKFISEKASKILSIVISYLVVLGALTITLIYVIPELYNSISELTSASRIDAMITTITEALEELDNKFPTVDFTIIETKIEEALPQLISFGTNMIKDLVPMVFTVSVYIVKAVINLLLSVVISVYMLSDKANFKIAIKKGLYAFVAKNMVDSFLRTVKECNSIFKGFIIGKSVDSLIIGSICFIAMSILKLPYALLLSVIVGITNMIPYFGPFIGAIPGVVLYLLINPIKSIVFAIMIFVLQQFDGLYLGPKILGNSTGLKPFWIIFAITVGGAYAGAIGMFLGVPVVAVISFLLQKIVDNKLKKKNITVE